MKKILTIIVALFMILLYGNISSADNEINNNDYSNIASACSVIDTSKLKEMSEKYVANENIKVDDTIPTDGSLDYTKFTYKNYYSQAIFGMVNYFENLSKYSPVNNLTTCGYVSLIQVLSYYDIDLFLWSEYEYLSTTDSRAYIQYKNSLGDWVTVMDLLSDIELSTDKLFPETYTILFPEKTKEFRIYIETASIGDRNKGRLCIGDLSIYLEG